MDERLFFPATVRNRDFIAEVLIDFLPQDGYVLEVGSGSGEHGVYFQRHFPSLKWQTSDPDPIHRKSISAWIEAKGLSGRMPQPLNLDVMDKHWSLRPDLQLSLKAIVCINMLHISKWECTKALFKKADNYLKSHQPLILYGPFKQNGHHTSKSNEIFDASLKRQNIHWGVRDLQQINDEGTKHCFANVSIIKMPANNLIVIFKKESHKNF